jgi:hypothetical protein
MMRNTCGKVVLLLCLTPLWSVAQSPVLRPQTSPFSQPAVSPYLNLSRGGNPALNYYNLVRPQQETQAAIQHLQQGQLTTTAAQASTEAVLTTGHSARFMNYSHYFYSNLGTQGALNNRPTTQMPYPLPSLRR